MAVSKKLKRILWIVAGVVAAVLLLVIAILLLSLDTVVRKGVTIGGTRILGVKTELASAHISLFRRSATLEGLSVANPEGFTTPVFVKAERIHCAVGVGDLLKDTVHMRELSLDSPEFTIEAAGGKSNIGVIMDRLKGESSGPKEEPSAEKKQTLLKIDRLTVTNVTVNVVLSGRTQTITIGHIEINDIRDANGNGVPAGRVVTMLLERIVTSPVMGVAAGVEFKKLKDQLPGAADTLTGAGKAVGDTGEKVGEGIKKIFK